MAEKSGDSETVTYGIKIINNLCSHDKFISVAPILFEYQDNNEQPLKEKRGGFLSLLLSFATKFKVGLRASKSEKQQRQSKSIVVNALKTLLLLVDNPQVKVNRIHLV